MLSLLSRAEAQDVVTVTNLASLNAVGNNDDGGGTLTPIGDGSFYGTTFSGGDNNLGTVFKLTADGTLTTLHSFTSSEGRDPLTTLVRGTDGNFYGTLYSGGPSDANGNAGQGSIYQITPTGAVTILHTFHTSDGKNPVVELLPSGDGGFYGGTYRGGSGGGGVLFKFTTAGTLTVLHQFSFTDASSPHGNFAKGSDGTIYGSAGNGAGNTIVYALTLDGTVRTVHEFIRGSEGSSPDGLLIGRDGNLYGYTEEQITGSSADYYPTIFRLTTAGVLTTLHTFTSTNNDADVPNALVQADDGNIYGVTQGTGVSTSADPNGEFFRITPSGTFTSLYRLNGSDGVAPARLVHAGGGVFYGTTFNGGTNDAGVIFKLTDHPAFFTGEVALAQGVYYLSFPGNGNIFGYYEYLGDPRFINHFDLGFEFVFDANDGHGGVYFYDFTSDTFFYTSPTFGFPYLYDFSLQAFLYYYPNPTNPQRYNTDGVRYFFNFSTGKVISK